MTRRRRDVLDQLEYEDTALYRLVEAMGDTGRDRRDHGRILKLFVERLAVRQAARETAARSLMHMSQLAELGMMLDEALVEHRRILDHLDEMTRGLAPTNVNQGQDVDAAIAEIAPSLLAEIDQELAALIPAVRHRLGDQRTHEAQKALPSAGYVLRHCPLHPGAHQRRWYERIGPLVWAHAVYDYLRSLPVGGLKPRATVKIPGRGELPLEEAGRRQ